MTQFLYILAFGIVFMAGFLIGLLFAHRSTVGTFRINHTDPSKDLVTLELDTDLDDIEKHSQMLLSVKVE